jgi:hypothetical protein
MDDGFLLTQVHRAQHDNVVAVDLTGGAISSKSITTLCTLFAEMRPAADVCTKLVWT